MSFELNFPINYLPLPDRSGANGLGELWIGSPNSDPKTNVVDRVTVYVVRQNDTPLAIGQPIELSAGGVPLYNGSPVQLEVDGAYCMQIIDRLGAQIYYAPYAGKLGAQVAGIVVSINNLTAIIAQLQNGISSFAALGTTPSSGAGQLIQLTQHTSNNLGGGLFKSFSGSVISDGGAQINSATPGLYWKRINYLEPTPYDFGCIGDDATNDAANFQLFINYCFNNSKAGRIPKVSSAFKLNSTITVPGPITLYGDGCVPYTGATTANHNIRGSGSWIHIAHTGKGFLLNSATTESTGSLFSNFATFRDHADPGGGWVPTAHDYDFYCNTADGDYRFEDMVLLNPFRGIYMNGRCTHKNIRGQFIATGIFCNISGDVSRYIDIHNWPFWSTHSTVKAYQIANSNTLHLNRCDNHVVRGIFSLWAYSTIRISQNASGTTSKLKVSDFDFDASTHGLWIDTSVTSGATIQIINGTSQSEAGLTDGIGIFVQGNNSTIDIDQYVSSSAIKNGIRLEGTGNTANLGSNVRINNWNQIAGTFPAVEALAGNTVNVEGRVKVSGGGGQPTFGTAAVVPTNVNSFLGRGRFTGTTDAGGIVTVTHALGCIPTSFFITFRAPDVDTTYRVSSAPTITGTAVKFYNTAGGAMASASVDFFWQAHVGS